MEGNQEFFSQFHYWLGLGEKVLLAIGIAVILVYYFRLVTTRDPKKKYDFINNYEIRSLKIGLFFIVISLVFLLDDLLSFQFEKNLLSTNFDIVEFAPFIGGFFVILIIGILIYTGLRSILNIYYPKFVGKRLDKIRYATRISPKSGNEMKLLNEDEEDVYLTEEMQSDEQTLKYDYDVWLDEQSGDVHIEKYDIHQSAIICPNCRYRTLKGVKDRLLSFVEGEEFIQRDFECSYCGYEESKDYKISKIDEIDIDHRKEETTAE
jgi:hypothetical protein